MRVLTVGAGAVGGFLAALELADAGDDVGVLVRPARADALRRDGLRVRAEVSDHHLRAACTNGIQSSEPEYDLIVLARPGRK